MQEGYEKFIISYKSTYFKILQVDFYTNRTILVFFYTKQKIFLEDIDFPEILLYNVHSKNYSFSRRSHKPCNMKHYA